MSISTLIFNTEETSPMAPRISFWPAWYWNQTCPEQTLAEDAVTIVIDGYFILKSAPFNVDNWESSHVICAIERCDKAVWKQAYAQIRRYTAELVREQAKRKHGKWRLTADDKQRYAGA